MYSIRNTGMILLLVHWVSVALAGEPKVVDLRTDRSKPATYSIVFMSRSGVPGHAFVAFSKDTEETGEAGTCRVNAFGFYPGKSGKGIVGAVPGEVVDESTRRGLSSGLTHLIVRVDRSRFDRAERLRAEWSSRTYLMTKSDCISFSEDVARTIGINVPDRRPSTILPVDYIWKLVEAN